MHKLDIKPLSVNHLSTVIEGRIRKTKSYKKYMRDLGMLMPPMKLNFDGKLRLVVEFGFSNPDADIDNPIKPFQDALQHKYGFNDRQIYELLITKQIVPKKREYIAFTLESLPD